MTEVLPRFVSPITTTVANGVAHRWYSRQADPTRSVRSQAVAKAEKSSTSDEISEVAKDSAVKGVAASLGVVDPSICTCSPAIRTKRPTSP